MSVYNPQSLVASFLALCRERNVPIDEVRLEALHAYLANRRHWLDICPTVCRGHYMDVKGAMREDYLLDILLCQRGHIDVAALGSVEERLAHFRSLRSAEENDAIAQTAIRNVAEREGLPSETLEAFCLALHENAFRGRKRCPWQLLIDPATEHRGLPFRLVFQVKSRRAKRPLPTSFRYERLCALWDAVNRELLALGYQRNADLLLDALLESMLNAPACFKALETFGNNFYDQMVLWTGVYEDPVTIAIWKDPETHQRFREVKAPRHVLFGSQAGLRRVTSLVRLRPAKKHVPTLRYPFTTFAVPDLLSPEEGLTFTHFWREEHPIPEGEERMEHIIECLKRWDELTIRDLQERYVMGRTAAHKLMAELEAQHLVGPQESTKPRKSLIWEPPEEFDSSSTPIE